MASCAGPSPRSVSSPRPAEPGRFAPLRAQTKPRPRRAATLQRPNERRHRAQACVDFGGRCGHGRALARRACDRAASRAGGHCAGGADRRARGGRRARRGHALLFVPLAVGRADDARLQRGAAHRRASAGRARLRTGTRRGPRVRRVDRRLARSSRALGAVDRRADERGHRPTRLARAVADGLVPWGAELRGVFDAARAEPAGSADDGPLDGLRAPLVAPGTTRIVARELAASLGRRASAVERALGPAGKPFAGAARDRFFPELDVDGWSKVVLAAAVRAFTKWSSPRGRPAVCGSPAISPRSASA